MNGSFVGLVQHDDLVAGQQRVSETFPNQDSVRHEFDFRLQWICAIIKADTITNIDTQLHSPLFRNALGYCYRTHSSRLRHPYKFITEKSVVQTNLRNLGCFAYKI
jgi:hypothetical protein